MIQGSCVIGLICIFENRLQPPLPPGGSPPLSSTYVRAEAAQEIGLPVLPAANFPRGDVLKNVIGPGPQRVPLHNVPGVRRVGTRAELHAGLYL